MYILAGELKHHDLIAIQKTALHNAMLSLVQLVNTSFASSAPSCFCVIVSYNIDDFELFFSSSTIYTFISCQNVTLVSLNSWHGNLSRILSMAALLIIFFLSFFLSLESHYFFNFEG